MPSILGGSVHRRVAGEGLGGKAGPPQPGGQRGRPRASGLGDEHLASRRNPGRGYGAAS